MAEENGNGADVDLKLAGQEVRLKNVKSLNTLATIAILIVVCVASAYGYAHVEDSKKTGEAMIAAFNAMTQAIREGTCINSYPEAERENKVEFCKRLAR